MTTSRVVRCNDVKNEEAANTQDEANATRKENETAGKGEATAQRFWRIVVLMNGKQVRVKLPPTVKGVSVEEFIAQNPVPLWLHANGDWELLMAHEEAEVAFWRSVEDRVVAAK